MILHVNVSLLSIVSVITFFIAALTLVMGSLGGGIAIGKVTSISCLQLANDPSNYNMFMRVTLLAMAFIESAVIYALIVALLLVTRGPIV
jgi:F0F1-type ATP synthase membrane subunit c/vacuolar-type H+-ATPase subunit K